jgi:uncharacterized protein (DUF1800 family)
LFNTDLENYEIARRPEGGPIITGETDMAAILRAVYSECQLAEMMTDFWSNHFNVWRNKNWLTFLQGRYIERAVRPHVLGRFSDLLAATTRAVPMLNYLDNITSDASKPGGVNQNYARELLELHTLGIIRGASYHTESDVEAVASLLSGWSINWEAVPEQYTFQFWPWAHDRRALSILGGQWSRPARQYGQGESDGIAFVQFLAHHPRTATYIALKLCRRFVGNNPSNTLVEQTAQAFIDHDTDIAATLRFLFSTPEFAASRRSKVRRPFEFAVAALRATNATVTNNAIGSGSVALRLHLRMMGQELFERPSPDGYPDADAFWLGADALLSRWSFGALLTRNKIGATTSPESDRVVVDINALLPQPLPATAATLIDLLSTRILGESLTTTDRNALLARLGLTITSPATAITGRSGAVALVVGLLLAHPLFHRR